jgi:hypothetical protein
MLSAVGTALWHDMLVSRDQKSHNTVVRQFNRIKFGFWYLLLQDDEIAVPL